MSLLPSTTEICFAIGAGDDVVGVTFECDYPEQARERTIVSTSAMPEGLGTAEIDAFVSAARSRGEDLYKLDEGALKGLDADLVITQDLCAVCAVDVSVVEDALDHLGCDADVLTIDPHTLGEVFESYALIGEVTGHGAEGRTLAETQRSRLGRLRGLTARVEPKRVMFLEWTDPPFAPGHWIPEMIEAAGGIPVLGASGDKSERVTWEQIYEAEPEVVVVAPCGYDREGSAKVADELRASGALEPLGEIDVHVVDANASWARPGTRLVEGIEELATLLHPEALDPAQLSRG